MSMAHHVSVPASYRQSVSLHTEWVDGHRHDPAIRFIIVSGMPGSAKSTLAIALAHHLSTIPVIDKDDI